MIGRLIEFHALRGNLRLSANELRALRERKLRAMIRHAYDNVPYYRSLFDSAGIAPRDIATLDDLKAIPISSKETLQAVGSDDLLAKGVDRASLLQVSTSGSTGRVFTVHQTPQERATRGLIELRALFAIGLRLRDRMVALGPNVPLGNRFYRRLGLLRMERVGTLLPPDEQLRRLQAARPSVLWAYPSALRALLTVVDGKFHRLCRPQTLITSSEVFDPVLRRMTVGSQPELEHFNFYACNEIGRIAWECRVHQGLHVNADYVIVETEPVAGAPTVGGQTLGETVITTLNAWTTPLIRYRLGDLSILHDHPCPCGRAFPLISAPVGRAYDIIKLPSGRALSPHALTLIFRRFPAISQHRVTQKSLDHLRIDLVLRPKLSETEFSDLRAQIGGALPKAVRFDIRTVESIPQETMKYRDFVSELQ